MCDAVHTMCPSVDLVFLEGIRQCYGLVTGYGYGLLRVRGRQKHGSWGGKGVER